MKRKFFGLGLSFLLVVSSLMTALLTTATMTACTSSTTSTAKTATATPTTGGTLTVMTQWGFQDPSGFDDLTQRIWSGSVWINP